jgi:PAS domain S-box-containing protein
MAKVWHAMLRLTGGIGWRLLVSVLFFSSIITLLLTLIQLDLDYRRDVQAVDLRMSEIDSGYQNSIGEGLWRIDARQLQLQIEGILRLPDISYVELREATDQASPLVITAGSHQAKPSVRREIKIVYPVRGAERLLGILVVEATFDRIYRQLLHTAIIIMVGQAIKTFAVSFFILYIVQRLITRHLSAIATSLGEYDRRGSPSPLWLDRRPPPSADEFDQLVGAFNQMCIGLEIAYGELREREAKVRRLIDANIIGICIFDPDRRIVEANDAFLGMVGYCNDDVLSGGVNFASLVPAEWAEVHKQRLVELISSGRWRPSENAFLRKDGGRVPVLVGGALFGDTGNHGVAFVVDLTEQKRAEAELAHVNRVATMGQLTASIGHEVNQPIAAMLMNATSAARWLAHQPPNLEEIKQSIDRIANNANRVVEIVRRIREFSKKATSLQDALAIDETILETIELTRVSLSDHNVSATTQFAKELPPIQGDRIQLQQVILNLIMNAIEAMSEARDGPRHLSIGAQNTGKDRILVVVSDSGPGLTHANSDRIFEAFYTTKANGLGMGLSICRSIVEAHGGRMWATQNDPTGAAFFIELPIRRGSAETRKSTEALQ